MKNWKILIIILLVSANLCAKTKLTDSIAAIVNNDIILESEINENINNLNITQYINNGQSLDYKNLRNKIIKDQIIEKIIFQMGEQIGLDITNDKLDFIIKNISAKNHKSTSELYQYLSQNNMTYDTYRKQLHKQIIMSIIGNKQILKNIVVYPQEINSYSKKIILDKFNEITINLSQIILPLPENPTKKQLNEKKTLAKNIIDSLKKGASFQNLANKYSSLLRIENLGWKKIKEIPDIFAEKLTNLKKDLIVGPIQSGVGVHILKINDVNNDNIYLTEMQIRIFPIEISSHSIDKKEIFIKLNDIIYEFNSKKINLENAIMQLSNIFPLIEKNIDSKWILFNNSSKKEIYNILSKLENTQMSKPVYFNGHWYILQKLNSHKINNTDTYQRKLSFMNIINSKVNEELEYLIQQKLAQSYIKIIENND
ncbi:hypothetical protein CRV11_01825 [Candidatus Pantoea edessiphila]|uniref:PpiC domain-containing protein n=1 Tax=Candidatus Pantoea edessiphila TaxID=2044610 RepID=A0A2P5SY35_9GAMM|nr:peptidylprolyl isomerase [Candidatus Pantoea edessiphila]MBK4775602.1 hypothetical protein [Pantoea sp. Edef]PPI87251.1 hypothetical protein CRV11_01825 [Candidatus Pantoea edessiphila]